MPKARFTYPKTDKVTSIQIHQSTLKELRKFGEAGESYEDIIQRFLTGEVWVDIISVDNESPNKHVVLFRLGKSNYLYDKGSFIPLSKEKRSVIF